MITYDAWPLTAGCELGTYTAEQVTAATAFAQNLLWARTGRQFGIARTTGEQYRVGDGTTVCGPHQNEAGDWVNGPIPDAGAALIQLAHQPVRSVTEVRIDGAVADPASWVLEGAMLRRVGSVWPSATLDEVAPIEVDYVWGAGWPVGTDVAMGELVCELLRAMTGAECRLPSRVVSIVRQGVTVELADPATFVESGRLGLPICDAFIDTVNPTRMTVRSRVFSPDVGRRAG